MSHTYEELKKKTVAELREIAEGMEHVALQGYTQLNKEHLLVQLCKALGIDMHAHRKIVQGEIKAKLKIKIKDLKKVRDEALTSGNAEGLKNIRRRIHFMKRNLRKAAVEISA